LLPKDALKDLLSQDLSSADKVLICLAVEGETAREVKEIRKLALNAGARAAKKWNVSDLLARSPLLAARTSSGWELTAQGYEHVARIAGPLLNSPIPKVASSLRAHLVSISNADSQAFVEEAIICFEARQYRAAVVLSWVGAVSVLYDYVVINDLIGFNAEALARSANSKQPWSPAKTADDLARMKESEFLVVLEKRSIVGKSVRTQLENCLNLRNGCGHPNSLKLAEHVVSSHIELLILNVFAVFG
jgi:hypothetical protein